MHLFLGRLDASLSILQFLAATQSQILSYLNFVAINGVEKAKKPTRQVR
jgi:hypothetical protein